MSHTCHLPSCREACPPAHLMCRKHWRMVPSDLAKEVYDTVKRRGRRCDETWAPWWRAQALAIDHVLRKTCPATDTPRIDRVLKREMDFANSLEASNT